MGDILLVCKEEAKKLAGRVLTSKAVQLQIEYMEDQDDVTHGSHGKVTGGLFLLIWSGWGCLGHFQQGRHSDRILWTSLTYYPVMVTTFLWVWKVVTTTDGPVLQQGIYQRCALERAQHQHQQYQQHQQHQKKQWGKKSSARSFVAPVSGQRSWGGWKSWISLLSIRMSHQKRMHHQRKWQKRWVAAKGATAAAIRKEAEANS